MSKRNPAKMKPRIKKKWTDALDSGKYVQCKESLKANLEDDDGNETGEIGHCCLGVLTDLYIEETRCGSWVEDTYNGDFKFSNHQGVSILSEEVAEWAGLKSQDHRSNACSVEYDPIIAPRSRGKITAASQNDRNGSSFKKISAMIKRVL